MNTFQSFQLFTETKTLLFSNQTEKLVNKQPLHKQLQLKSLLKPFTICKFGNPRNGAKHKYTHGIGAASFCFTF